MTPMSAPAAASCAITRAPAPPAHNDGAPLRDAEIQRRSRQKNAESMGREQEAGNKQERERVYASNDGHRDCEAQEPCGAMSETPELSQPSRHRKCMVGAPW